MKLLIHLILLLFVFFDQSCGQVRSNSKATTSSIDLRILDEQITLKEGSTSLHLTAILHNKTDGTHLFYNTKYIEVGHPSKQNCNDNAIFGVRMTYTILYQNYKVVPSFESIGNNNIPVTADSLRNVFSALKDRWINDRIILAPDQVDSINYSFKIRGFELKNGYELKKGTYYIYLFYRAGSFIEEFLGKEQISKDMKEGDAELFLGCIKSNVVPLVVE